MMIVVAAIAAFIFIAVVAYVLAPPSREDDETESMIFGTLLFGEMDGEE